LNELHDMTLETSTIIVLYEACDIHMNLPLESLFIVIISLLISPLLEHRPSLWITLKEKGSQPDTRAQCGLVGANDYKCSRDQRLTVSSEARKLNYTYNNNILEYCIHSASLSQIRQSLYNST
jgi:hypothetical protein